MTISMNQSFCKSGLFRAHCISQDIRSNHFLKPSNYQVLELGRAVQLLSLGLDHHATADSGHKSDLWPLEDLIEQA